MLFDPTAIEKLSQLVDNLIQKQHDLHAKLESNEGEKNSISQILQDKDSHITQLESDIESKNRQIEALNEELKLKDIEIEAIIAKIESMLG